MVNIKLNSNGSFFLNTPLSPFLKADIHIFGNTILTLELMKCSLVILNYSTQNLHAFKPSCYKTSH